MTPFAELGAVEYNRVLDSGGGVGASEKFSPVNERTEEAYFPLATRPLRAKELPWLVASYAGIPEPADNGVRVQMRLDLLQALVSRGQTDMDRKEMVWLRLGVSGLRHSIDLGTWAIRDAGSGRETDDQRPLRILMRSGWVPVAGHVRWLEVVSEALLAAVPLIVPHDEVRRRVVQGRKLSRSFIPAADADEVSA